MPDHLRGVSLKNTHLLLAVNPIDALTGRPLRDSATVTIDGVHEAPRLNPSGYWLFLDPPATLPADEVTVTIETPPEYVDRELTIDTSALDPLGVRIEIDPAPPYQLPAGSTVVQGRVEDGTADPVVGATVGIEHTSAETTTGFDGQFVLVVEDVTAAESAGPPDTLRVDRTADPPRDIQVKAGRGPTETPTIVVNHPDHTRKTHELVLTEGTRHTLDTPITL